MSILAIRIFHEQTQIGSLNSNDRIGKALDPLKPKAIVNCENIIDDILYLDEPTRTLARKSFLDSAFQQEAIKVVHKENQDTKEQCYFLYAKPIYKPFIAVIISSESIGIDKINKAFTELDSYAIKNMENFITAFNSAATIQEQKDALEQTANTAKESLEKVLERGENLEALQATLARLSVRDYSTQFNKHRSHTRQTTLQKLTGTILNLFQRTEPCETFEAIMPRRNLTL